MGCPAEFESLIACAYPPWRLPVLFSCSGSFDHWRKNAAESSGSSSGVLQNAGENSVVSEVLIALALGVKHLQFLWCSGAMFTWNPLVPLMREGQTMLEWHMTCMMQDRRQHDSHFHFDNLWHQTQVAVRTGDPYRSWATWTLPHHDSVNWSAKEWLFQNGHWPWLH